MSNLNLPPPRVGDGGNGLGLQQLPTAPWVRGIRPLTSQKNGIRALSLPRVRGLGNYKTAWALLHTWRRAMVRPGRERLRGRAEVGEAYWGGAENGVTERKIAAKALIVAAVELKDLGRGRIRLRHISNLDRAKMHRSIHDSGEPGGTVYTDGLQADCELGG